MKSLIRLKIGALKQIMRRFMPQSTYWPEAAAGADALYCTYVATATVVPSVGVSCSEKRSS